MKLALVKHTPKSKAYWFEVPEELTYDVQVDTKVLCDTQYGEMTGIVVACIMDETEVGNMVKAAYQLRKITAAECEIRIDMIRVPEKFKSSPPHLDKINARLQEYYYKKRFKTRVTVSTDNMLTNGYSAYLAAKAMRMPSILAFRCDA